MPARSLSLLIHRYVGLWTGLFLFAIALTGCLLVFQDPIDRALHPSLSRVTPREGRQKVEVELQAVRLAFPDDAPTLFRFGAGPGLADEVRLRSRRSVFVDPYDARVLGVRDRDKGPLGVVRAVHVTLFAGGAGRTVVGIIGLLCTLMVVTGLRRWWGPKILGVSPGGTWKRRIFELHNLSGALASIFVFIVVLTGGLYAFEELTDSWLRKLGTTGPQPRLESTETPGAASIDADSALAVARAALQGGVTMVSFPSSPKGIYRVYERMTGDHTPNGRGRVYVNRYSAAVLGTDDGGAAGAGLRIISARRALHTGEVWGWPTKLLVILVGLVLMHQAMTGFLIWLKPKAG